MDIRAEIGEYLNGREYALDGIDGTFRYITFRAVYPYQHDAHQIYHTPTERGRQTDEYRAIRRKLGDDWDTDLTDSDRLIEIALALGFDVTPAYAALLDKRIAH